MFASERTRVFVCVAALLLSTLTSRAFARDAQDGFVPPVLTDSSLSSLKGLDAEQVESLKQRVPELFALMMGDEQAAYDKAMQQWGGERAAPTPVEAASPNSWMEPDAPGRIVSCDHSTLELAIVQVLDPSGRDLNLKSPKKLGGPGMFLFSRYNFGVGQQTLASRGSPVVRASLMTEQASGEPLWLELYVVWEPTTKGWVPWIVQQEVKPGKTIPSRYL